MREAQAAAAATGAKVEIKKSICTHCSVGCTVLAEVQNGVWIGQEPGFDSPFNLGAHCAKGASVREHAHGDRRLKYPMKLSGGKWTRISWDVAINEVGDKMLEIRQKSGPDSVYWLGSAKHSNEQAYLIRKFAAFWGSNNVDHQARICHSTTVAGVANTWGYGAMTNSYNDIQKSKAIFLIGGNPAEAHPVSVHFLLKCKEQNNAAFIVCDPRFTRTAAHATEYVRLRPGTDVALIWGILWHIFENGWEDKEYIRQRVWGMEFVREEVKKWTPAETEKVTGVPGAQLRRVARTLATNKPGTIIWCMGGTQHTNGNNNTRAYCILQLALGNIGVAGGGANIFRGHDNVQGATDLGVLMDTLPGYYGLAEGSWKHWARVWDVPFDYLAGRFHDKAMLTKPGIPVSRWFDGVLEDKANITQPDRIRAMVFWGHAPNSQTRLPDMKKAMEKLDLLVIIDPHPTMSAVMPDRQDGVYLLPAATQFETYGSVTASNRSLQWREKVFGPFFEALPDHTIMYKFAKKFGFDKEMFKHIKVEKDEPLVEDITLEFNRGMWTIGYTGQSPERMKLHMANQHTFDRVTLKANGGPCDGDYYGLPWPCWGTAAIKHPGTPNLYDTSKSVAEGGLTFRNRFGLAPPKPFAKGDPVADNLLAVGSYSADSEIKDGYPEFTMAMLTKLGWDKDLTEDEKKAVAAVGRGEGELEGRPIGRHPARGDQAWCCSVRQRQGTLRGVELPRSGAAASRASLHAAARPGRFLPHIQGPQASPPADPLRVDPEERLLEGLPDHPHLRTFGGVRGWRRRDPVQSVARRAAAEHVHRDPPLRCQQPRHPRRTHCLGRRSRKGQGQGHGDGHGPGRQRGCLHAVPFRRPLPGQGPARQVSAGHRSHCARRSDQHGADLRLRCRHADAGNQSDALQDLEGLTMARMKFLCDAERCIECNACVTACKNEHEVPWGVNRRRVVTINDGKPGERSISVACMHCSDAPCAAVCPVDCFYQTEEGVVLHNKDLCIGCGYCFYACPFGAPQYPQASNFGSRGKMDKCTFCAGGPEKNAELQFKKYGRNRLAEGKLPLCAEMCSTKALLAGDGDVVSAIYRERVVTRGFGSGAWGWGKAYPGQSG